MSLVVMLVCLQFISSMSQSKAVTRNLIISGRGCFSPVSPVLSFLFPSLPFFSISFSCLARKDPQIQLTAERF